MPFGPADTEKYGKATLEVYKPTGDHPDLVMAYVYWTKALETKSFAELLPYLGEGYHSEYRGHGGPNEPVELKRGMDFHWSICKGGRIRSISMVEPNEKGWVGLKVNGEQLVDDWIDFNEVIWYEKEKDGVWRQIKQDCIDCGYPDRIIEQMMKGDY